MKKKLKHNIEEGILHFHMEASDEVIENSLKEVLPDFDTYQAKKEKAIKKLRFLANATAKKEHDEKLLKVANMLKEGLIAKAEKPINILKSLMSPQSLAFYSNLDKLTEQDIYDIIKDKSLIDLLEQLDGNEAAN